jgi:serine/threonine-protein kinase
MGEVLDGKYRIERLLGEGGMGAVAKATHLLRRAPVALKFMSPAVLQMTGAVERFVNEGVAASQIDSDHVVKIFDVGRMASGAPYLVMEYLEGCDLAQLLEREGPVLGAQRAVNFTLQILRALQAAHAAGIVHRDMKPSNCFVITKDGDPDFIKLVDFGISKVKSADEAPAAHLTRTNSALGTPLYMSPEQARSPRDVDHRTDLYSVGAILYEMLTGRTPYTADSGEYTEILFKIFTTDPEYIKTFRPGRSRASSTSGSRRRSTWPKPWSPSETNGARGWWRACGGHGMAACCPAGRLRGLRSRRRTTAPGPRRPRRTTVRTWRPRRRFLPAPSRPTSVSRGRTPPPSRGQRGESRGQASSSLRRSFRSWSGAPGSSP